MKNIAITKQSSRNIGGSHLVNYEYVLTDELGSKKAGTGSFATVALDSVNAAIRNDLARKLGYQGFDMTPFGEAKRPQLSTSKAKA